MIILLINFFTLWLALGLKIAILCLFKMGRPISKQTGHILSDPRRPILKHVMCLDQWESLWVKRGLIVIDWLWKEKISIKDPTYQAAY